ncbi:MAG TPA: hypothetical protein VK524_33295 [Polyangiaceae bacterium]|nr:hypothetical protein [Polyangiaceae bacterium]
MRKPDVEVVLENDAVILRYHTLEKIVHHELRRFVHGAQLREVLETGLELFRKHGANKWLSDDRGNGPLKPADEQWARTEWFPMVKAAGWKYWAVVLPEKVLGQMNMKRWIELYAAEGIEARAFTDPDEALEWIREC